jgi:transcriptional regulator with XRE-family HTH domain
VPGSLQSITYRELRRLLVEARTAAALTQAEVARRLGRPQSFVSKYESGERRLDIAEFLRVCKAIGIAPDAVIAAVNDASLRLAVGASAPHDFD